MPNPERFVVIPDGGDGHPMIVERSVEDVISELTAERKVLQADNERLLHGICDALNALPTGYSYAPATVAILRALLRGTRHEDHGGVPNG